MTSDHNPSKAPKGGSSQHHKLGSEGEAAPDPEWTNGLRQLYDSVVEEPLPDSFMDLLSKLDPGGDGDGKHHSDNHGMGD